MDPLPVEEVIAPPFTEQPNPNEQGERNPGDPTVSLNADGTVANTTVNPVSATVPVNADPHPTSDPAHVESPYQPPEALAASKEAARLREESIQAENRWRPSGRREEVAPEERREEVVAEERRE